MHLISNENVFTVIGDSIVHELDNNPSIYFQLLAVYTLVNCNTGDVQTWTGSFNPRNRQPSQLTTHRHFEADVFIEFAQQHSSVARVIHTLTANYIGAGQTSV